MRPAPPPEDFRLGVRALRVGDTLPPDELVAWLVDWGYTREAQVEAMGHLSKRGGIVDVYSPGANPLRIEFFGNELESIRGFDLVSQASVSRREGGGPAARTRVPAAGRRPGQGPGAAPGA